MVMLGACQVIPSHLTVLSTEVQTAAKVAAKVATKGSTTAQSDPIQKPAVHSQKPVIQGGSPGTCQASPGAVTLPMTNGMVAYTPPTLRISVGQELVVKDGPGGSLWANPNSPPLNPLPAVWQTNPTILQEICDPVILWQSSPPLGGGYRSGCSRPLCRVCCKTARFGYRERV
jgi:hypothetical protein